MSDREPDAGPGSLDGALAALDGLITERQVAGSRTGPEQADAVIPVLEDVVLAGDPELVAEARAGAGSAELAPPPARLAPTELIGEIAAIVDAGLKRATETARRDILREVGELLDFALAEPAPLPAPVLTPEQALPEALPKAPAAPVATIETTEPAAEAAAHPPAESRADMSTEQPSETQASEATQASAAARPYEPHSIERHWYETWERQGCFRPSGKGRPYCIMLPPPNVTGSLHMGHAFQDTLMDALVRFHRMKGFNTLWQCGTDHAGIATQMVVERQLGERGVSRHDLGRERFVEEIWRWKERSGGTITRQLRRMGASMDWSRERFTLDEGLSRAVTEVFVRLHEQGLVYRGQRLVNWDPVLHTAISDLEVLSEEENGHLWHIRYPLAEGEGSVTVATTRPETLLGDTAVAVHPEDERYRHLVGRRVLLPLTGRSIPVVADDYVDPAFGSGCVKITPAHDFNDYAVGQRHGLPLINIFTVDAALNDNAPEAYRGLDRYEARKRILADLEAEGLLVATEARRLMVPRGDRSNAVIEPYLTDQWFVRVAPLAEPAIAAVEDGRIRFVPENWAKTYFEWMRNIQDWCISRQLWWGHRIPAWYDASGQVHVGRSEEEVRAREGFGPEVVLTQDPDVLDTWFSSALWPFSTLGWPERSPELSNFYPTAVLVSGFDIIFFWVARMIMMGLAFTGQVPFREVYIHGLVRDQDGQKMSKSKGNILDPIDLIDGIDLEALVAKRTSGLMRPQDAPRIEAATRRQFPQGIPSHGTDALRFTFAALATHGRDIKFDLGRIEGYRNFCNKLWNAARYVSMSVEAAEPKTAGHAQLGLPERWIRSRFQAVTRAVTEAFGEYRFDLAAQALYTFVWDEFCDWYLELSKTVLTDPEASEAMKRGTCRTLIDTLEGLLRLAHPIMPFITEELWQRVAPRAGIALAEGVSIMQQPYPVARVELEDAPAERELEWLKSFVLGVRRIRAEMNIPPGKPLPVFVRGGSVAERLWLANGRRYLLGLARASELAELPPDSAPEAATALAGGMTLLIPLADLIDPEAEHQRLGRELERMAQERGRLEAKLANDKFVERAPPEVVAKERARYVELGAAIARLEEQRGRIDALRAR